MHDHRTADDQARQERAAFVPAEGARVVVWPAGVNDASGFDREAVWGRTAAVHHRRVDGWIALFARTAMLPASRREPPRPWARRVTQVGEAATELALATGRLYAVPTSGGSWVCRDSGEYALFAEPDPELC